MIYGKKPIGTISYLGGLMSLPEEFCWSWSQMIQFNNEYLVQPNEFIYYIRSKVSFHSAARNWLVDNMKGDWILMLDTDHVFEPDLAARMVNIMYTYDLQVLTGIYLQKGEPHMPVIYHWEKGDLNPKQIGDWEDKENHIFPIGSAGGGCLLIRKNVLNEIKIKLKESPFDIISPLGEDHSFFKRLQKLNIQAFCAPFIESNHLSVHKLELEKDYKKEKVELSKRILLNI